MERKWNGSGTELFASFRGKSDGTDGTELFFKKRYVYISHP
jgi:hypothetical protein